MIDLRHILVPTDFSKSSVNALTYGVALAERFGAELHLLHVVQDLALFIPEAVLGTLSPLPPSPPVEQFTEAARAALERVLRDVGRPGLVIHPEVAEGVPFQEILRVARERTIDLIVMGTHGHTGLAHVLLGSVVDKVVRRAPCPVLTVRHPEHEFVHP
jgi:nucleotide-binding universal stress UspA family protein